MRARNPAFFHRARERERERSRDYAGRVISRGIVRASGRTVAFSCKLIMRAGRGESLQKILCMKYF